MMTNIIANPRLAAALAYAESGLHVFPAPRGYKMSYKSARHYGTRWGATTDARQIEQDWSRWPDANVCIACGSISGIFVVDVDTLDGHGVDGNKTLAGLIERFGSWPVTRQAQSPSGSTHYYFRTPGSGLIVRNSTGSTSALGPGVDVRGEHGMIVAPPSVKADGSAYRWLNRALIENAPQWLLALVAKPDVPRIRFDGDSDGVIYAPLVAETVAHVPVASDWSTRNTVGLAIFACTNGSEDGFAIWDAWLRRSGKYNGSAARQRWAAIGRCPPTSIGYGSLAWRATRANPRWLDELDAKLMREVNAVRPCDQ